MKNFFIGRVILSKFILGMTLMGSVIYSTTNLARAEISTSITGIQVAQSIDPWTAEVRNQLILSAAAAGYEGNTLTHDPFIGNLGNGGTDNVTLNLTQGVTYKIFGVCDEDCRDIDLELYDDNGQLVDSDTTNDDVPIVSVSPRWNARFTIRAIMPSCSNGPCRYGIGVFGK
jgi:hypothetical protein